jgi:photosystem II stability/assembly factor-like uncharacterized protein
LRATALLLLTTLWAAAPTRAAAAPRWTQATPSGGSVVALARAPSSPQTMYCVAFRGRFFASQDGGGTWTERPALAGIVGLLGDVADLAVDPTDRRIVYALGSSYGVLRTRNGGRSWSSIGPDEQSVAALLPGAPGNLLAATGSGLFRSIDGGDTWNASALSGTAVVTLTRDPLHPAVLLAAAFPAEPDGSFDFWRSGDDGATWAKTGSAAAEDTGGFSPHRLVFDPTHPGTVYALLAWLAFDQEGPVLRSTDSGASWAVLPAAVGVRDLAPLPDGTLLAATDFGVARSTDQGETWTPPLPIPAESPAPPRDRMAGFLTPTAPGPVLAFGGAGIWRSVDGGASWAASSQGIQTMGVISIAAAPVGPDAVFAVATDDIGGPAGVYRSTDHGATWTRLYADLVSLNPLFDLKLDPRHPRTMYAEVDDGQDGFLVKSTNGGRDWTQLDEPYACHGGSSICSSTIQSYTLDPNDPDVLYISGTYYYHYVGPGRFLLRSRDAGATWDDLKAAPAFTALAVAPGRGGLLYGNRCGKLLTSRSGEVWRDPGNLGLPPLSCYTPPAFDPRDPRRIYSGTAQRGVFVSEDGGATWTALNAGLGNAWVMAVLVDPQDPRNLYAAVPHQGVFRWSQTDRRWLPLGEGLPLTHFTGVIALDPQHPSILWAATQDQGLFRLDLGEDE